ncbi:MAG: hypothetical protein KF795_05315 [Labilithrix sp.]|nr:hypothetical protein [Labilithrix sp.]
MLRRRFFTVLALSVPVMMMLACSADDEAAAPVNGVNDVGKACAIRAQWTKRSTMDCSDCLGVAVTPLCDCTAPKPYAGKCHDQQNAKYQEPTCSGVGECVFKCSAEDCGCVEACYAGKDECRVRGAAVDGCIAEVCDTYCR